MTISEVENKWNEQPDGECEQRKYAKAGDCGGVMYVQPGAGHQSTASTMVGSYFEAGRRLLFKAVQHHVCPQERRRPIPL